MPFRRALALTCALASAAVPAAAQRDTTRAAATPLPGIVARAEREACPSRDDPHARALWTRMRDRYDTSLDSASMWAELRASSGYVREGGLFAFDTVDSNRRDLTTDGWNVRESLRDGQQRGLAFYVAPRVGKGRRGMSGRLRGSLARTIAREGYATLNAGVSADLTQASAAWTYPALDAELASHFIDDGFGGRTLFRIDRDGPAPALGFCTAPRYRSQPYISGTLFLRADTSLERVRWHVHTPEPQEDAGGEVRYRAPVPGERGALTALQGEFYRRQGPEQFYHRRLVYLAWTVDPARLLPDSLLPAAFPASAGGIPMRSRGSGRRH
jgi:hypothetical protein